MAGLEWAKPSSSYNQYEEYRNLPKLLKRFSLEEKMRIACKYSAKVTSLDQVRKPEDMQLFLFGQIGQLHGRSQSDFSFIYHGEDLRNQFRQTDIS